MRLHISMISIGLLALMASCSSPSASTNTDAPPIETDGKTIVVEAESFVGSEGAVKKVDIEGGQGVVLNGDEGWLAFDLPVSITGRYRVETRLYGNEASSYWIEDYVTNKDGRTYNITGASKPMSEEGAWKVITVEGSPLDTGVHPIRIHLRGNETTLDKVTFTLMREHEITPEQLTAEMTGTEPSLVWSDEFEGEGLPDTSKWTFDVGNWGWGNNEPQYYTVNRTENARLEEGTLIIEARKGDMGQEWTSARLTTRGKTSFLYGRIEFRAKVPALDGTWAAGWLLGDAYRDEISWPYCGEIDVLECVGSEIDDEDGDGINHASCHTRAFYFKNGNHITATLDVDDMVDEWHTYSIDWSPEGVVAYLDGEKYYTYDKLNGPLEWPFDQPQNLIVNLAMGGGMGGEIDPAIESQQFVLDYVRVYELK